jgi:protein-S-isoprenylcysteine O-methyltransferase Ste14
MQASRFEYRFRFILHAIIYILGFTAPWLFIPALANVSGFAQRSTWLIASSAISHEGWLTFSAATIVLLALALLFTALGAFFRIGGSAYVGASVVNSSAMHAARMLADGPYRRTRNPLYLGTLLHTIGIAILMPPSGAVFAIVLFWIFEVRLALAEEPFLTARFGQPYVEYKAAVPRFLPTLSPQIPAAGAPAAWLQAILSELYFPAAFLVLAIFGWSFNAQPIHQGLLISFGVWLIVRALLPPPIPNPSIPAQT